MKTLRISLLLCFMVSVLVTKASQKHPVILTKIENTSNQEFTEEQRILSFILETKLIKKILKEFPCVELLSKSDIVKAVAFSREAAILGNDEAGQKGIELAQNAANADYVIYIQFSSIGETNYSTLSFADPQGPKTLIMKTASGKESESFDKIIEDFVTEMAYLEICPYTGQVNVNKHTTLNTNDKRSVGIYCNEQYQNQVTTTIVDNNITTDWKLKKNGYRQGTGEMSYKSFEEITNIDENPCYPCSSGRFAGRISHYTQTTTAEGNEISTESRNKVWTPNSRRQEIFSDVRIKLRFNQNGTYLLVLNATSNEISATTKIEEKVTGSCETEGKNESHSFKKTIFLDMILGPFNGTPFQKTLKESGEKATEDNKEKTVIKYDFELIRE